MSETATKTSLSYLIVFDGHDDSICSAGELMMSHGSEVQWVPDVYSAMAQLCTGNLPSRLIVDVRILDESELAFINLAPRYFPDLKVTVPVLDGTLNRINGFKGRFETLQLTDITDEALGIRIAVADEITDEAEVVEWGGEEPVATDELLDTTDDVVSPALIAPHDPQPTEITISDDPWAPDPAESADAVETEIEDALLDHGTLQDDLDPARPHHTEYDGGQALGRLSTDGGPESPESGPSLHDAVRQRMGGSQPMPGRRLPPGSMAFNNPVQHTDQRLPNEAREVAISPEEMDALLADDAESLEGGSAR